jgi:hypothetical protein
LKAAIDSAGEGLPESGFADSGNTFDEQVSAGENADQREADDIVFPADYLAKSHFQLCSFGGHGGSSLWRHCWDSTIRG